MLKRQFQIIVIMYVCCITRIPQNEDFFNALSLNFNCEIFGLGVAIQEVVGYIEGRLQIVTFL